MIRRNTLLAALAVAAGLAINAEAPAQECAAASGPNRAPLLELYTSEGCSSCPPADRWLSGLQGAGLGLASVVPIAFHVDYWDRLGWVDRFAQSTYSQRQHGVARQQHRDFVFTPQIVLDGQDFRSAGGYTAIKSYADNASPEHAHLDLKLSDSSGKLGIDASARLSSAEYRNAELFIAVTENHLASQVSAGENGGRRLVHDAVARTLIGPFAMPSDRGLSVTRTVEPGADWNRANLTVVAFVQDRVTGEVLQSLGLRYCR